MKIHILLGTLNTSIEALLKDALSKVGYDEIKITTKKLKIAVTEYLEKNRDVDVLILAEALETAHPYQISEYAKYLDLIDNLLIIPILTEHTRNNKAAMKELYNNNILTAVYGEVTINEVVNLILNKRNRLSARELYGINGTIKGTDDADYESCVNYISSSNDKKDLSEKCRFIREKMSETDFKTILKLLPQNVLNAVIELHEYDNIIMMCGLLPDSNKKSTKEKELQPEMKEKSIYSAAFNYKSAVKKVIVGVCGVQNHIGATFESITFAHYLSQKKYKVALVEDIRQQQHSFKDIVNDENGYRIGSVDYFPEFNLNDIAEVLCGGYNFVIIDFGVFRSDILTDFNRCTIPVIVSGAKKWELKKLDTVFETVNENMLISYYYIFNNVEEKEKKEICKNMSPLNKIFFADNVINPFAGLGYPDMEYMLEGYLPEDVKTERKMVKNEKGEALFNKFKRLFE